MRLRRAPPLAAPTDPVLVSSFFGAFAGVLSLLFPYFDGLALVLSALLLVAWVTVSGPSVLRRGVAIGGVGAVAAGWAFYLLAPGGLSSLHGAVLGLAGVPLGVARWRGIPRRGGVG